jgi:uncharacterized alkaline shock family protein YloU
MTEYQIATSVLETIVRESLAGDNRVRVHSPLPFVRAHTIEVHVQNQQCKVTVQLDALLGEHLPGLANDARGRIAAALAQMTGLKVDTVDVVFAGVFPSGS